MRMYYIAVFVPNVCFCVTSVGVTFVASIVSRTIAKDAVSALVNVSAEETSVAALDDMCKAGIVNRQDSLFSIFSNKTRNKK